MKIKWTIEIEVDETWVADGFDIPDDDAVQFMTMRFLPYAYGHEIGGKVLKRPPDEVVAKLQGYKTVEDYLKDRSK